MPYVYWNNGLSSQWHDPSENYQLQAGQVEFAEIPTTAQLEAAFSGYAAAAAAAAVPAQYAAAIAAGLAITSTGTPAVNGTYACDENQQDVITRLQTYIAKTGVFPGGLSSIQLRLVSGAYISIPSVAVFQNIATAIGNYVADADNAELAVLAGSSSWSAPGNAATIA